MVSSMFCALDGTLVIARVALCANTIRHNAATQVTIVEFVIGNPNNLTISSGLAESACSACDRDRFTRGQQKRVAHVG